MSYFSRGDTQQLTRRVTALAPASATDLRLLIEHGFEVPERDAPRSIDLIVHRRGTDEKNLLAVEIKRAKNTEDRDLDHLKLQALMEELGYRVTLFLEFGDHGEVIEEVWTTR